MAGQTNKIGPQEEARRENLVPAGSEHPQVSGSDVVEGMLADAGAAREVHGITEGDYLDGQEDPQGLCATGNRRLGLCQRQGGAENDTRKPKPCLDEQHRQHLMAAYSGELDEQEQDELYELGIGVPPDAEEHAALLAELEGDDEEDEDREVFD